MRTKRDSISPTEPDPLSAEDAIANLRFQMSAIFGEYYPEARLKLASLAASRNRLDGRRLQKGRYAFRAFFGW